MQRRVSVAPLDEGAGAMLARAEWGVADIGSSEFWLGSDHFGTQSALVTVTKRGAAAFLADHKARSFNTTPSCMRYRWSSIAFERLGHFSTPSARERP